MLAGALLALSVTHAAASLGPRLSGLFAMFPVMSTVLVGFSDRAGDRGFAVALLRGMVNGYYAIAVFCLVLMLLRAQLAVKWLMHAALRGAACRPARGGLE